MKKNSGLLLLFLALLHFGAVPPALAGPIYVFKERDGTIRFSSREPPKGVAAEIFTGSRGSVSILRYGRLRRIFHGGKLSRQYSDVIERASQMYNLERHLIQAVIHVESYFDPQAVSPKGARGLMQLMPATAQMLGVRNTFGVEDNIMGGARYLSFLLRKYSGNLKHALAAYNAGEGAVSKYNGIPPYQETIQYVDQVLRMRNRYQVFLNG